MKRLLMAGPALLALTGCSDLYVPHDSKVPHGYQERFLSEDEVEVSYESYKRLTPQEACDLAHRRLEELAEGSGFRLIARHMEERDDVVRVPETIGAASMLSTGPRGTHEPAAGALTPAYDIARTIKRCTLKAIIDRGRG